MLKYLSKISLAKFWKKAYGLIPKKTSHIQNDAGFISVSEAGLSKVAETGSFNDLKDKPDDIKMTPFTAKEINDICK